VKEVGITPGNEQARPYRRAFLFSRTGTYVSLIYAIASVGPHDGAAKDAHEKKSNEDGEHPY